MNINSLGSVKPINYDNNTEQAKMSNKTISNKGEETQKALENSLDALDANGRAGVVHKPKTSVEQEKDAKLLALQYKVDKAQQKYDEARLEYKAGVISEEEYMYYKNKYTEALDAFYAYQNND